MSNKYKNNNNKYLDLLNNRSRSYFRKGCNKSVCRNSN